MKIRTVKPEFWSSPSVQALPMMGRLLFIGLLQYVDDNGVGLDSPVLIASEIFPREMAEDSVTCISQVDSLLWTLHSQGTALRFTGEQQGSSRELLGIPGFAKHQYISKPAKGHGYTPLDSPKAQVKDLPDKLQGDTLEITGDSPVNDRGLPLNPPARKRKGKGKGNTNPVTNVTVKSGQVIHRLEDAEATDTPQPPSPSEATDWTPPETGDQSFDREDMIAAWAPTAEQASRARAAGIDPDRLADRIRVETATAPPFSPMADWGHAELAAEYERRLAAAKKRQPAAKVKPSQVPQYAERLEKLKQPPEPNSEPAMLGDLFGQPSKAVLHAVTEEEGGEE